MEQVSLELEQCVFPPAVRSLALHAAVTYRSLACASLWDLLFLTPGRWWPLVIALAIVFVADVFLIFRQWKRKATLLALGSIALTLAFSMLRGAISVTRNSFKSPWDHGMLAGMAVGDTLKNWAKRIKRDAVTLWFAGKHPATPWYAKALGVFVVAYALSPIDLIPDFIPVLGYVDDVLLLPALIWLAIRLLPPEVAANCRKQADAVDEDAGRQAEQPGRCSRDRAALDSSRCGPLDLACSTPAISAVRSAFGAKARVPVEAASRPSGLGAGCAARFRPSLAVAPQMRQQQAPQEIGEYAGIGLPERHFEIAVDQHHEGRQARQPPDFSGQGLPLLPGLAHGEAYQCHHGQQSDQPKVVDEVEVPVVRAGDDLAWRWLGMAEQQAAWAFRYPATVQLPVVDALGQVARQLSSTTSRNFCT